MIFKWILIIKRNILTIQTTGSPYQTDWVDDRFETNKMVVLDFPVGVITSNKYKYISDS